MGFLLFVFAGLALLVLSGAIGVVDASPSASTTRAKIVFTRGGSVYLVSADGSGLSRVLKGKQKGPTAEQISYQPPAWSPDGNRLAVVESSSPFGTHGYDDVVIKKERNKNRAGTWRRELNLRQPRMGARRQAHRVRRLPVG